MTENYAMMRRGTKNRVFKVCPSDHIQAVRLGGGYSSSCRECHLDDTNGAILAPNWMEAPCQMVAVKIRSVVGNPPRRKPAVESPDIRGRKLRRRFS